MERERDEEKRRALRKQTVTCPYFRQDEPFVDIQNKSLCHPLALELDGDETSRARLLFQLSRDVRGVAGRVDPVPVQGLPDVTVLHWRRSRRIGRESELNAVRLCGERREEGGERRSRDHFLVRMQPRGARTNMHLRATKCQTIDQHIHYTALFRVAGRDAMDSIRSSREGRVSPCVRIELTLQSYKLVSY